MYDIHVYDQDQLDSLPEETREQVVEEIEEAATHRNPNSYRNAEKLNTKHDLFKIRVGSYRVIFGVVSRYLIVFRVCYRGDAGVYRNLEHLEDLWEQAEREARQLTAPVS